MKAYYDHYFPADTLHQWLNHNSTDHTNTFTSSDNNNSGNSNFHRREFSFTIEGDIYLRYLSFAGAQEFKQHLLQVVPDKIDIGAVFSTPPKDHSKVALGKYVPREKEMVLDIDMTDYDNVRLCGCTGASVCRQCWQLMNCAVVTVDYILETVFGFRNRLWVFSGRRGMHCWICDRTVRAMPNDVRESVASFLQLYGGEVATTDGSKVSRITLRDGRSSGRAASAVAPLHPTFDTESEVFIICEQHFLALYVDEWHLLEEEDKWRRVLLPLIRDAEQRSAVEEYLSGERKLGPILQRLGQSVAGQSRKSKQLSIEDDNDPWDSLKLILDKDSVADIVYALVYPRLDANVSKQLNHLLKSPFSVHPKTGKVCVPFDSRRLVDSSFSVLDISPDVHGLVGKEDTDHIQKMADAVKVFRRFVKSMEKSEKLTKPQSSELDF